jgi:O-antigen biosynthesis protein
MDCPIGISTIVIREEHAQMLPIGTRLTSIPREELRISAPPRPLLERPALRGKFLYLGGSKWWVKGVTYGTFRPDAEGCAFPSRDAIDGDFAQIAANGMNAVRTYTVPPVWLLDSAFRHGLAVMVGIPWEQHVAFLDDRRRVRSIHERVRLGVKACGRHPAVFCYAIGNEIPSSIVRWYGARRVERFLGRLCEVARAEDPEAAVTYVNYPSTEYLELPFADLLCFNVYLESQPQLEAYLARIQNMAGDRPLIMGEVGLDSLRHGELTQAITLSWQIRTIFESGCAGAFVFGWTDEWHRGGLDIENWRFGITDKNRDAKPALLAIQNTLSEIPFSSGLRWPRISVVVCAYNEARTIRACLEGLQKLEYPDFEIIVIDDGSKDATAAIAREYGVKVISTENRGLSFARNLGFQEATGEIVAYIDADAYPDPHWLVYLAATFMRTDYAGVGGPNIPPPGCGRVADCVGKAPGGPIHVLLSDTEAEHIPGCNLAIRKEALQAIGGFDTQFRIAGDDVDVCWRVQQQGGKLGFNPAAVVWHHRRNSIRAYWRQQKNYGRAEAMLERKWPEKYNGGGHLTWTGRVYGNGHSGILGRTGRIYHGTWNSAPFQSLYLHPPGTLQSLTMIPEWYLVLVALAGLAALGFRWRPLLVALPLLVLGIGISLWRAWIQASHWSARGMRVPAGRFTHRILTALLHVIQPLARLYGRLSYGLHPLRLPTEGFSPPRPRTLTVWSEEWRDGHQWLHQIEETLQSQRRGIIRGGNFDRWDLEARAGLMGSARLRMAIEEHGQGKQLLRFRVWPKLSVTAITLVLFFGLLALGAVIDRSWLASVFLGLLAVLLGHRALCECSSTAAALAKAVSKLERAEP